MTRCGQQTSDGCNRKQPDKYKFNGLDGIKAYFKGIDELEPTKVEEIEVSVEYIRTLFERISDEDANFLGFSESIAVPNGYFVPYYLFHLHR